MRTACTPEHAVPAAGTTPALFEATAAAEPDRPAVAMGSTTLTYAELNAEANRLARRLVAHGVGPERLVALTMTLVAGSDVLQFLYDSIQNGALAPREDSSEGVG